MTPERWEKVKDIFAEATEVDAAARPAFITEAVDGDAELAAEVQRLLWGSTQDLGLLSRPVCFIAGTEPEPGPRYRDSVLLAKRFEILRFIAHGGMGEVYEALDRQLGEHVALKTIRGGGGRTRDLLALLKNEVQLARRVTHPNVCRIYDLAQEDEGGSGEPTLLLSMELLRGKTLTEHLSIQGPFAWRDALPIIEQIGAGIQAAHEAGVIHGDLKPGNIMLCGDSNDATTRAVVMDFGVAVPTAMSASQGGTPAYFAPEQAEGKPLTPATDVYSFAALISHMLGAGRPGSLQRERIPLAWADVLDRCFENDPARRIQSAAAFTERLRKRAQPKTRQRALQVAAVVAAALSAVALARHSWTANNPVLRQLLTEDSGENVLNVSPDGKLMAETLWDNNDLGIRDVKTGRLHRITRTDAERGAWAAVFSPDSTQLAYQRYLSRTESEIRLIGVDGKGGRVLYHDPHDPLLPLAWSSDGGSILAQSVARRSLYVLSAQNGVARAVSGIRMAPGARATFSPDGRAIVLEVPQAQAGTERLFDLRSVSFDGQEKALVEHPSNDLLIGWAPDGRLVFSSDRSGKYGIWAVRVRDGKALGEPEEMRPGAGELEPLGISRDGSLFYKLEARTAAVYTAAIDVAAGRTISPPRQLPTRYNGPYEYPNWSEDDRLVFSSLQDLRKPELGVYRDRDGTVSMLPVNLSIVWRAQWVGPEIVALGVSKTGVEGRFRINPVTGAARLLATNQEFESAFEGVWSQDGSVLYDRFSAWRRGLFRLEVKSGAKRILYVPPAGVDIALENLALSPDGQSLAFHARNQQSKTASLMVVPALGGDPRAVWTIQAPDAFVYGSFTWTPDSKQILAARTREGVSQLWRIPVDGSDPAQIEFPAMRIQSLRLNRDGKRIAFTNVKSRNEIWEFARFLK